MSDRQPLRATLFAFERREESAVLLNLALAFTGFAMLLAGLFIAAFWGSIGPFFTWYGTLLSSAVSGETATPEAAMPPLEVFGLLGGLMLWLFPFYILCASFEAGALRWLVRGEKPGGVMGLSLGVDTWRVWSVYWMWLLLNIAFSMVISIVMGVLIGILALSSAGDPMAVVSGQAFMSLVQYALMAYFGVRFAPAAATTIARRRFAFFDAWTVTKGRFWALFGSFLLLYLAYMIVSLALGAAAWMYILTVTPVDFSGALAAPEQVVSEIFRAVVTSLAQPQSWAVFGVLYLTSTIFALAFYVATYGVNARAATVALEEGKVKPYA